MRKGEVVSAMPLVALNQGRNALTVINSDNDGIEDNDEADSETEKVKTRQLLYNYMLEHPQSSALFFPAGAMTMFINHGAKKKANVKMIWSTKEWSSTEFAHATDVHDLTLVGQIDMMLELVATRPIKQGEEILLDYGDDWASAWKDHLSKWSELIENERFSKSAMTLNEIHHGLGKPAQPFPTVQESDFSDRDDRENVVLQCHLMYDEGKIERRRNQDGSRTKVYPWIPHPVAGESRLKTEAAIRGVNRKTCEIVERSGDSDSGYKYIVRPIVTEGLAILVKNVPHYAIRYTDKPYTNAQHGVYAFRHAIQFPDDIFPKAWRDLAEESHSLSNDEL